MDNITNLLKNEYKPNILVIGDIILDEYIFGRVERISQEAPVQIVNIEKKEYRLGGAGNVANNLKSLGCNVSICGVIGNDPNGKNLDILLENKNINTCYLFYSNTKRTITKTRVIADNQQILRLDEETTTNINKNIENNIFSQIKKNISVFDVVIISDYLKGTMTYDLTKNIISCCKENKITVVVDPKGNDYTKYTDADILTPNEKELFLVSLEHSIDCASYNMIKKFRLKSLLVTRGKEGINLYNKNKKYIYPAEAKDVFDVSGAGDTVVAVLSFCLGKGIQITDATRIANVSAGIVVGKIGTSAIELEQLLNKITEKKENIKNKKIVFTNGCFDLLHTGHISLLQQAKFLGDVLIVGLNSDKSIKNIKGEKRPIINQESRKNMLLALSCVDSVVLFDDETPIKIIEQIKPDILVKGDDYKENDIVGSDFVKKNGGKVVVLKKLCDYSTTNIIDKIIKNYEK